MVWDVLIPVSEMPPILLGHWRLHKFMYQPLKVYSFHPDKSSLPLQITSCTALPLESTVFRAVKRKCSVSQRWLTGQQIGKYFMLTLQIVSKVKWWHVPCSRLPFWGVALAISWSIGTGFYLNQDITTVIHLNRYQEGKKWYQNISVSCVWNTDVWS